MCNRSYVLGGGRKVRSVSEYSFDKRRDGSHAFLLNSGMISGIGTGNNFLTKEVF